MKSARLILLLALGGALGTGSLLAQSAPPTERPNGFEPRRGTNAAAPARATPPAAQATPAAGPESPAPAAAQPNSTRERAVSPGLAAALAERMPRYSPPPPPREPTEEEIAAAQPRNRIIRLPQMVVEGQRPPVFAERDLHTKEGLAALAVNRYLSELDRGVLNRYTLPLFGQSQEQRALAQYAEDERLRNMATAEERARLIEASEGGKAAGEFRDTANAAFIRSPYLPEPSSISRD
ncbi:MAG TPA: hypothetical protein VHF69_07600 [Candidatus Synoicihabitans sp.]|nr:hypothetical protein [Candidatus Synoicihabitans sp.]